MVNSVSYKVRSSALAGFSDLCRKQAVNPLKILAQEDMSATVLRAPDLLIPYASFARVLAQAAIQSNDSLFGFRLSQFQGPKTFGPLGLLAAQCNTCAESMNMVQKYLHFHVQGLQMRLKSNSRTSQLSLNWAPSIAHQDGIIQVSELSLGLAVQVLRELGLDNRSLKRVSLKHAPEAAVSDYKALLDYPVVFEQSEYSVEFSSRFLAQKPKVASQEVKDYLEAFLARAGDGSPLPLKQQVIQLIRELIPTGEATVANVASLLGRSVRMLQYELQQAGLEFRQLLNKGRLELACEALAQRHIVITDLALMLGYSEVSAFSRAFKRWTGFSPQQWREQQ
ncbi:AraC family transcriptional regulator [Photobacterium sp. SDRW27]|uniref:AraC family transcriptional regulator n=1 Tax=Photobacterium obscurum TaxID=2829490 RepID=UPI002242C742|nr:AraC family transcriptional regulator [Photobacterium obscurum]MCW8329203.1 AraC family transcriptional regulator [Photobacterium obscurum]